MSWTSHGLLMPENGKAHCCMRHGSPCWGVCPRVWWLCCQSRQTPRPLWSSWCSSPGCDHTRHPGWCPPWRHLTCTQWNKRHCLVYICYAEKSTFVFYRFAHHLTVPHIDNFFFHVEKGTSVLVIFHPVSIKFGTKKKWLRDVIISKVWKGFKVLPFWA